MDLKIVAVVVLISLFLITPVPRINSITPDYGLNNGMVDVIINGEKFDKYATVKLSKLGEPDIVATSVKIISKKQISCSFDLHGQAAGKWDVMVANKSRITQKAKNANLNQGFTIQYPAPVITMTDPNHGVNSEIVSVNLTGDWFRDGAKVILYNNKQRIEVDNVRVVSTTQITSKINLEKTETGIYDVKVVNDDGKMGILEKGFIIGNPAPEVTTIEPNHGNISEEISTLISGSNFKTGAKVEFHNSRQVIEAFEIKVLSSTQISSKVNLNEVSPGTYNVTVTNDDGKSGSLSGGFTIEYPAPTVREIKPTQGLNSEIAAINLLGTNFRDGAKVELHKGNQSIKATGVKVISNSQIAANFNLVNLVPGTYDVTVTNDDGKSGSLSGGFTIKYPAPTVMGIEPTQGLNSEVVTVNLRGTNFRDGAQVELHNGNQSIKATGVKVISNSQIAANFNLVDSVPGTYDVTVTNDDGKSGSLTGGFKIVVKPTINLITPAEGFNNGSLLVEITGTNFLAGALVKLMGAEGMEIPGINIEIKNTRQIACFFDLDKKPIGTYDVVITNPNGQKSILPGGFTIKEYIPTNQEINDLLKPVFFDYDRFEILAGQIPLLEADVKILNENPNLYILLGGHADERGTREYNLELSKKRAEAIKEFLSAKGVDLSRITIYAYGKDYPARKGHDESFWWYNRRVDIIVWESPPTKEQGLINILNPDEGNN